MITLLAVLFFWVKNDNIIIHHKKYAKKLSEEKGLEEEFALYDRVERIAAELIAKQRKTLKTVSANVDFYSGFVYTMLKLPIEIFTPIFAISRISGWSAHRIEELVNNGKIIRPAYMNVGEIKEYSFSIISNAKKNLSDVAVVEKAPKVEGRSMTMFLTEKR